MRIRTAAAAAVLAAFFLAVFLRFGVAAGDLPVTTTVDDTAVVVELFTSQGCSSCPPADAVLGKLAKRRDVLPLAFHVDYWDYIGWKDPYASKEATDRQYAYGRSLGLNMVYTPQMVIDGSQDVVGSDEGAVIRGIAASMIRKKLKLSILRDSSGAYRVAIPAGTASSSPASVYIALFDKAHRTDVRKGENADTRLTEFNIVREWRKIGVWKGQAEEIALNLTPESDEYDACAIIVQDGTNGPVRGAASFRMEKKTAD
jgi:hypothetical protein